MCEYYGDFCRSCEHLDFIGIIPTEWKKIGYNEKLHIPMCVWNEVFGVNIDMLQKYPIADATQCVNLLLESLNAEYDREEEKI